MLREIRIPVRHIVVNEDGETGFVEVLNSFAKPGLGQLVDHYSLNTARNILIKRGGNIGDVVMLTPTLRHLHEEYAHLDIHVATRRQYAPLLEGIDYITVHEMERLQEDDMRLSRPMYDLIVETSAFVERSPRQYEIDRISLFGEAFGLRIRSGYPIYHTKPEERAWAEEWVKEHLDPKLKHIGLAPFATDPRRSWPAEYVRELAELVTAEAQLLFFHHPKDMRPIFEGLPNVLFIDEYKIREVAALLPHCHALVSVDTGMYHLAAAVQRKIREAEIATPWLFTLFGQWPPELRVNWYKNRVDFYPDELKCVPCYAQAESFRCHVECMSATKAPKVWKAIKKFA